MKWWIENGQVVSSAIDGVAKPDNWIEVEGVEAGDRQGVYFDGSAVVRKPPQPSPHHIWIDNQWIDTTPPAPAPASDWPAFRLGMMANDNYNLMLDRAEVKGASRTVSRLETAVNMAQPHHESIVFLWGQMRSVLAAGELPTVAATREWEAIAAAANMPFEFAGKGEMKLREAI